MDLGTNPRADLAALLAHRRWLQRLAHHLIHPSDVAEDAVQDTWLAAVRSPAGGVARDRGWLFRVLVNAVRRRVRGDRRRQAREQAVAGPAGTSQAPAAAGLEQMQLQRRLTALVDALDEPFRSTVVMRYFEERTAADIARSLGVPEGTVRWRTGEALTRLRRALEEQSSDRTAWRAMLAPLASGVRPRSAGSIAGWAAVAALLVLTALPVATLLSGSRGQQERGSPVLSAKGASVARPRAAAGQREQPGPDAERARMVAGVLALASRKPPAIEALTRARALWTRSCSEDELDGLCATATVTSAAEGTCPQAGLAGPRLAAVPRRQSERDQALQLWTEVSEDKRLPYELRIQADLALAETKLEALLALPPITNLELDRHNRRGFDERVSAELTQLGQRARESSWAFERLVGASAEFPEVRMARARLAQTYAEAGRLKLAMTIPRGLLERNKWGRDERELFCQQVTKNAQVGFTRARRNFRSCLDAPGADNPEAAALCARELERLPPAETEVP